MTAPGAIWTVFVNEHSAACDLHAVCDVPQHAHRPRGRPLGRCPARRGPQPEPVKFRFCLSIPIKRYLPMQAGRGPAKAPEGPGRRGIWIQGGTGPEPTPLYINVKALFFQGKCTNLCKQNQQISALNNWILRAFVWYNIFTRSTLRKKTNDDCTAGKQSARHQSKREVNESMRQKVYLLLQRGKRRLWRR